jgi:tRNA (mo5U34)-methyltransferase
VEREPVLDKQALQPHPINGAYTRLRERLATRPGPRWLSPLLDRSDELLENARHGDLPRWLAALRGLPETDPFFDGGQAAPVLGRPVADGDALTDLLMELHPWRKGPLIVGGVTIDTEWRSDWKWDRIADCIDLSGHEVLDIGCGNGYFGWRMLGAGASCVVGLDPTLVFVMQWLACRHFCPDQPNFVLPLGAEDLPDGGGGFDTVFSMGVLYHRKDPVAHLRRLAGMARSGGQVVLETLVLDSGGDEVLVPEGRYARMRNVHAVPSVKRLKRWMLDAGLAGAEVLDVSPTTTEEQRSTDWMRFESLAQCLDPSDSCLTVEGHPAPARCAILCRA